MKNYLTLIMGLFLCFSMARGQDNRWELGLNLYPNFYWKYNKFEYNIDGVKAVDPKYGNGIAFGVTVQRNLNEKWSLSTGLEYSKQSQKFISSTGRSIDDDLVTITYPFNQFSTLDITYVSLPIKVVFGLPIGKEGNWEVFTQQGVRISYLANYSSILKTYQPNGDLFSVLKHNYGGIIQYQSDTNDDYYLEGETAYKYFVLGYTGNLGLKRKISDKISISVDARFDYDLTNSDNEDGLFNRTTNGISYPYDEYNIDDRKPSHNMRVGLEFGFGYRLD